VDLTVRRSKAIDLTVDRDAAKSAVGRALSMDARYRNVRELEEGFEAEHVLSALALPTAVAVSVSASGDGSRVEATATSQWFIYGDIFRTYNRTLSKLLRAVSEASA
jgi:hypothetical protein